MTVNKSVAMATFNGAKFLEEQLISLSKQTILPSELCVTDDGSSDETLIILEKYSRHAPFPVRTIKNNKQLGYGRNFLKAASLCMAEYVAFCDQDDVWCDQKIQKVGTVIEKFSPDVVVHSGIVVDQRLTPLGYRYPDIQLPGWLEIASLSDDFYWPGYSLVIKRSLLDSSEKDELPINQDGTNRVFAHDHWVFNAVRNGASCYKITDEMVKYRQHTSNLIGFAEISKLAFNYE